VEANIAVIAGLFLTGLALLAYWFPRAIAYPIAVIAAWFAVALLYRGFVLFRQRTSAVRDASRESDASGLRRETD
jgi:hypothetical protein